MPSLLRNSPRDPEGNEHLPELAHQIFALKLLHSIGEPMTTLEPLPLSKASFKSILHSTPGVQSTRTE